MKKKLEADDLEARNGGGQVFPLAQSDRCGMFFANHVLIVEGPSEQAFINKLIGDGRIKRPADGLYVLDTIGKFNIHRFMNLLSHMGIQHSVIHDDDNNQNEHADVNQLIQDSKHTLFTIGVNTINGDIEMMLGIPKTKSEHRKPQHLLFLHETGQIATDRLEAFCGLVEGCLPQPPKEANA